jgi:hypothetical protein|tara:strand:+ start:951 stop:1154 length:204 start_codon:yes stop_codon:yes gene_type:complete
MGKRKRIRIQVGELGALIKQREESKKKMFGELVTDIMNELGCSWAEAKKVYKFKKVERAIARELQKI